MPVVLPLAFWFQGQRPRWFLFACKRKTPRPCAPIPFEIRENLRVTARRSPLRHPAEILPRPPPGRPPDPAGVQRRLGSPGTAADRPPRLLPCFPLQIAENPGGSLPVKEKALAEGFGPDPVAGACSWTRPAAGSGPVCRRAGPFLYGQDTGASRRRQGRRLRCYKYL